MTSFTSNSNGHDGLSRKTKSKGKKTLLRSSIGLSGFIVLLILAEVFIFRNLAFYGKSPGFIGQIAEMDASFQAENAEQIQVGIFGDSLGMDALRPDVMASASGMQEGSIYNFSLSGGSAYDIAQIYKQYEDELPNMKQAIVVINEHQFNNAEAAEDIKFKYFAGISDRLKVMNSDNYGDLLLGWMLKSYDMRTIWTMMWDKYRKGELRDEVPIHNGGLAPVEWSPPKDREPAYAKEVADRWFENYDLEGVRTEAFERMLADMQQRGIEIVLVQLPRSEHFEKESSSIYMKEQNMYLDLMQELADQYGAVLDVLPKDLLTFPDHFRDVNHVNPAGAEIVSNYVSAKWLIPQD
ncbi:hypothetical protein [Marinicrinis lubricantis]|uniref:SGNH hydrolase-type esterase domain-containing protein n=1 Tax=Marinicrinis lubricantis TaxID=2086470 RepID=A0ABW1IL30_9BACL